MPVEVSSFTATHAAPRVDLVGWGHDGEMDVRRVVAGEGARLRELRLRALREDPYAFSASFERARHYPLDTWNELAAPSASGEAAVVVVAVRGAAWLGLAGGYLRDDNRRVAGLWGMWVAPSARGRGFGRQLVEAIAEWARTRSASRLELSVSERAETAAALYRQLGFAPTGEQQPLESDPSLTKVFLSRHL